MIKIYLKLINLFRQHRDSHEVNSRAEDVGKNTIDSRCVFSCELQTTKHVTSKDNCHTMKTKPPPARKRASLVFNIKYKNLEEMVTYILKESIVVLLQSSESPDVSR